MNVTMAAVILTSLPRELESSVAGAEPEVRLTVLGRGLIQHHRNAWGPGGQAVG